MSINRKGKGHRAKSSGRRAKCKRENKGVSKSLCPGRGIQGENPRGGASGGFNYLNITFL